MTLATQSISKQRIDQRIPPLCNGDTLSRKEFERRYRAMPESFRAELIEGRVYVSPPVSLHGHGVPHLNLAGLLFIYQASTPGVVTADNATVRLDDDNEPQPDLLMMITSKSLAQSAVDDDDYVTGAPELAVEIARSSVNYDLREKLEAYRRNGVREYIVWRTFDQAIDYFILRDSKYVPLAADANGVHRSEIFPGLWIDAKSLLAGKLAQALVTVQQGTASPEHAAFVAKLNPIS